MVSNKLQKGLRISGISAYELQNSERKLLCDLFRGSLTKMPPEKEERTTAAEALLQG